MKRLLSSKELAETLGLADNTLRIWRLNGEGPPYYKVGDTKRARVRYDLDKVEAWLAVRERESV